MLLGQNITVIEAVRQLGISEQSNYRWRNEDLNEIELLKSRIKNKFAQYQGKQAGLVTILGYHQNVTNGVKIARKGYELRLEVYKEIFTGLVTKFSGIRRTKCVLLEQ